MYVILLNLNSNVTFLGVSNDQQEGQAGSSGTSFHIFALLKDVATATSSRGYGQSSS